MTMETNTNMMKITIVTVNVAAMALRQGQYKHRIVKAKKGKGSYNRKDKW